MSRDTISTYLLCVAQGLFKMEGSGVMNKVRLGLGEYAMSVHQADFLHPSKRVELLQEIIHALDKDNLSEDQFFETVLDIRSSDQVRHKIKEVKDVIRNHLQPGRYREPTTNRQKMYSDYQEPTFEDRYTLTSKKIKIQPQDWNLDAFVSRMMDNIYEDTEDSDFDISPSESSDTNTILYYHNDHPKQERDLMQDVQDIFENKNMEYMPKGIKLSLLGEINRAIIPEDLHSMPTTYLNNLKRALGDFDFFENSIVYE